MEEEWGGESMPVCFASLPRAEQADETISVCGGPVHGLFAGAGGDTVLRMDVRRDLVSVPRGDGGRAGRA